MVAQRNMRRYLRLGHRKVEIHLTLTIPCLPIPPATTSTLCPHGFVPRDSKDILILVFFFKVHDKANQWLGEADQAKKKGMTSSPWFESLCFLLFQHEHIWTHMNWRHRLFSLILHPNCFIITIYFSIIKTFLIIPEITLTNKRNWLDPEWPMVMGSEAKVSQWPGAFTFGALEASTCKGTELRVKRCYFWSQMDIWQYSIVK